MSLCSISALPHSHLELSQSGTLLLTLLLLAMVTVYSCLPYLMRDCLQEHQLWVSWGFMKHSAYTRA